MVIMQSSEHPFWLILELQHWSGLFYTEPHMCVYFVVHYTFKSKPILDLYVYSIKDQSYAKYTT